MKKMKDYRLSRSTRINWRNLISISGTVCAVIITAFVLFYPPMPGVADQGDFQRVMSVTGLDRIMSSRMEPHWFKYVTTEYDMNTINLARLTGIIPTTSMIYPIMLARIACTIAGKHYFSTRYLAFFYACMYILSIYACFKCIRSISLATYIFFTVLSLLILFDGNYLVWFNSLYGEPMMFTGLLSFASSVLYASSHIDKITTADIILIFISSILFLGAKMQCFTAAPFIILMFLHIAMLQKKHEKNFKAKCTLIIPVFLILYYVGGIYLQVNNTCGIDTEYNSVFYGILKNSNNPERDLAVLGLSPDLAVEAGKHAYLPRDRYVKYIPGSDLTKSEFNDKISNLKLLKFYILQPERLIKGMEYTASKCFNTKSSLGKYEISDIPAYTSTFKRFTIWSDFKSAVLPKKLSFILLFYITVISLSIKEYLKNRNNICICLHIKLLWTIIIIGLLQFPMPYIGNGEADTSKQLFLFNYSFDITFLCACTWLFNKLHKLLVNR